MYNCVIFSYQIQINFPRLSLLCWNDDGVGLFQEMNNRLRLFSQPAYWSVE